MSEDVVIFDIDGTLADLSHRLHHVKNEPKDWNSFFDTVSEDTLIEPIAQLFWFLTDEVKIIFVSGRSDICRTDTQAWLNKHLRLVNSEEYPLYMRANGDKRPDDLVKEDILDAILAEGHNVIFTVDDRPRVVDMWRRRGITCLQCREWSDHDVSYEYGVLTLLVGPSGAGKSTWVGSQTIRSDPDSLSPSSIISSDELRAELCGDFKDQRKNGQVFEALHALVEARISNGLDVYVDATNLRNKDRLAIVKLAKGHPVVYRVFDRPLTDKHRDAGWRADVTVGKDDQPLIEYHHQIFKSNLKDIMVGDNLPNVTVIDMRVK